MVRIKTTNNLGCEISLDAASFNSVNISCANRKIELTPKITALDVTSRVKDGVLLDTVMSLHNTDEDAHKALIKELRTKNLQQDVEIAKKANISTIPTKTSDLVNDSDFVTNSELPTVGNGTLTISQNGNTIGTFNANQTGNTSVNIDFDADEITTRLNGKADVDFANVNNTGYIKMAEASMPSNTFVNLTVGASGTTYTAPANGWFSWAVTAPNLSYYYLINTSNGLTSGSVVDANGYTMRTFIPAAKGDVVKIEYQWTPSAGTLSFIYATGSESEAQ